MKNSREFSSCLSKMRYMECLDVSFGSFDKRKWFFLLVNDLLRLCCILCCLVFTRDVVVAQAVEHWHTGFDSQDKLWLFSDQIVSVSILAEHWAFSNRSYSPFSSIIINIAYQSFVANGARVKQQSNRCPHVGKEVKVIEFQRRFFHNQLRVTSHYVKSPHL